MGLREAPISVADALCSAFLIRPSEGYSDVSAAVEVTVRAWEK